MPASAYGQAGMVSLTQLQQSLNAISTNYKSYNPDTAMGQSWFH